MEKPYESLTHTRSPVAIWIRAYNPKERVNPKAQLDPTSGKSMEYVKSRNLHEQ